MKATVVFAAGLSILSFEACALHMICLVKKPPSRTEPFPVNSGNATAAAQAFEKEHCPQNKFGCACYTKDSPDELLARHGKGEATVLPWRPTSGRSSSAGASSAGASTDRAKAGSIDDPQAATNHEKVKYRAECPGLYIPRVFEEKFENMIPTHAMYVVNRSDKRYTVKYDMVYTRRGAGGYFRGVERSSSEKTFTIRPKTMAQFYLAKRQESAGYIIDSIDAIEVFECAGR